MADNVQHELDLMVPSLVEFQERGIFQPKEVRLIVAKRREFEYKLRRQVARKQDFLQYLTYEMKLEALRKLRRKKAKAEGRLPSQKASHDYAVVKHIRNVFDRATHRFLGDVGLWAQYVQWAVSEGSRKIASRAITKALQFHPHNQDLWIMAAKFEFFNNSHPQAGRVLMQRALRLNPRCPELWEEYSRLEWHFTDIKRTNFEKKQLEKKALLDVPKLEGEENSDSLGADLGLSSSKVEASAELKVFLEGAVPLAVFKSAIRALPQDLELRWKLAQVAMGFDGSGNVVSHIRDSIHKDFKKTPEGWEVLARFPTLQQEKTATPETEVIDACIKIYEEGVQQVPEACASELWEKYAKFVLTNMHAIQPDGTSALLSLFNRASEMNKLTASMGTQWLSMLQHLGELKEALKVCKILCNSFAGEPSNWIMMAKLLRKSEVFSDPHSCKDSHKSFVQIIKEGLKSCSPVHQEYPNLWKLLLEELATCSSSKKKITKTFKEAMTKCPSEVVSLGEKYLIWANFSGGIAGMRSAFQDLLSTFISSDPTMVSLFDLVIRVELSVPREDLEVERLRNLFESALDRFGNNHQELWTAFEQFERNLGFHKEANSVKWRAQKANGEC